MKSWTLLFGALLLLVPGVQALAEENPGAPTVAEIVNPEAVPAASESQVPLNSVEAAVDAAVAAAEPASDEALLPAIDAAEAPAEPQNAEAAETVETEVLEAEATAKESAIVADAAAPDPGADVVGWNDSDDPQEPEVIEIQSPQGAGPNASSQRVMARGHTVRIGPIGIDADGEIGRVHTVERGDTLWDISEAYLGTPWVWPSVWTDNREIENPHLIEPQDRVWITSTEIRRVSEEEANQLVSDAAHQNLADTTETVASYESGEETLGTEDLGELAAMDEDEAAEESEPVEQLSVAVPDTGTEAEEPQRVVRISTRAGVGFISDDELSGATSVIGSAHERVRLSQPDIIYLGMGSFDVNVGDQLTIFRSNTPIKDPRTGRLLGHYIELLGWVEVIEVSTESSVAVIRESISGIVFGDRATPRAVSDENVVVIPADAGIEGYVAFLPKSRTLMGTTDFVFLDMGAVHGLAVGTDLEIYERGSIVTEHVTAAKVMGPDRVIADLIVVTVEEESSVAFVQQTRRELAVGDSVRGATRTYSSAF